jgi:hypothetical protein
MKLNILLALALHGGTVLVRQDPLALQTPASLGVCLTCESMCFARAGRVSLDQDHTISALSVRDGVLSARTELVSAAEGTTLPSRWTWDEVMTAARMSWNCY